MTYDVISSAVLYLFYPRILKAAGVEDDDCLEKPNEVPPEIFVLG